MAGDRQDGHASTTHEQGEESHAEELRRTNKALDPGKAVPSADGGSPRRDTLASERGTPSVSTATAESTAQEVRAGRRDRQQWMAPQEIVEALAINSPALAEALFIQAKDMMAAEDARDTSLGAKAAALLGAGGLSLTVAFTFGGFLLQHPDLVATDLRATVLGLYCLALVSGLGSAVLALVSIFVTERYEGVDERVVLDQKVLRQADNFESPAAYHYRYQTAHLWQVYQANARANHRRASTVRMGQVLYLSFLLVLMAIGLVMTYSAYARIPKTLATPPATAPPVTPTPPTEGTARQEPTPPVIQAEPSEESIMPTAERPPPPPTPAPGPGRPVRGDPQPPRPPPPPTPVPGPGRERPPG